MKTRGLTPTDSLRRVARTLLRWAGSVLICMAMLAGALMTGILFPFHMRGDGDDERQGELAHSCEPGAGAGRDAGCGGVGGIALGAIDLGAIDLGDIDLGDIVDFLGGLVSS